MTRLGKSPIVQCCSNITIHPTDLSSFLGAHFKVNTLEVLTIWKFTGDDPDLKLKVLSAGHGKEQNFSRSTVNLTNLFWSEVPFYKYPNVRSIGLGMALVSSGLLFMLPPATLGTVAIALGAITYHQLLIGSLAVGGAMAAVGFHRHQQAVKALQTVYESEETLNTFDEDINGYLTALHCSKT